jgi:phosphatidate cytidylyltransferase
MIDNQQGGKIRSCSNATQRVYSALIGGPLVFFGVLWSSLITLAIIAVIIGLCIREYMRLLRRMGIQPYENIGLIFAALFLADAYFTGAANAMPLVTPFFLVLLPWGVLRPQTKERGPGIAMTIMGTLYLTILPGTLVLLRNPDPASNLAGNGGILVTLALIIIWALDVGAYVIGSMYGRTPFFPSVSPKKTWEGAIGGVLCAVVAAVAAWFLYVRHALPLHHVVVLAFIGGVTGQIGDLIQSKVKRLAGVKDASNVIPGHGGFWDRFDSLIFTAPVLYGYIWYFVRQPAP